MLYLSLFLSLLVSLYSDDLSMVSTENDPSTLVEGVSVITGDLYALDEDYVVQGAEPIRIRRSFLSRDGFFKDYQHLTAVFQCSINRFVVNEPNGTAVSYYASPQNYTFPSIGSQFYGNQKSHKGPLRYLAFSENDKGLTNTKTGDMSAHSNLKNQTIVFDPAKDPKGKSFTLYAADGTQRRYINQADQHRVESPYGKHYIIFNYKLVSETLPNGHIIHYQWDKKNRLVRIYTTNGSQSKIFASLNIPTSDAKDPPSSITLTGSDGRSLTYKSQPTAVKRLYIPVEILTPDLPTQRFGWDLKLRRGRGQEYKMPYLEKFSLPQNRTLHIGYSDVEDPIARQKKIDEQLNKIRQEIQEVRPKAKKKPSKYKPRLKSLIDQEKNLLKYGIENEGVLQGYQVRRLSSPVGKDSELITTHTFCYDPQNKNSYVLDVKGNKTAYFWNDDYRLTEVHRYIGTNQFHSKDVFVWEKNLLKCKALYDERNIPILARTYGYDQRGNVIEDSFYGNLSGASVPLKIEANGLPESNGIEKYTRKKTYSDDGRNLLLLEEESTSGLRVAYTYRVDAQLPLTKTVYQNDQAIVQYFYEYDADLILIKEVISDPVSKMMKTITPHANGPYVGMPHIITESFGDQNTQLRKTVLFYGKGALIEKKEIYDAYDDLRFCLEMSYDDKGRLLTETNAIGQKAFYRYDEVGNRVYAKDFSNRLETFCEYDASNRLIKKALIGDDGIHQTYSYEYDTKHNLIFETDPYGNQTSYIPDTFGHKKEIHLPQIADEYGEISESITLFVYDAAGNRVEKKDALGNVTKTDYNAYGKPICITHPDGSVEKFCYYLNGNLKSHRDENGTLTSYEYDALGRVVKKIQALSEEIFEYTGKYLTKKIDAEKNETLFSYDQAGRKIAEELAGEKTLYAYDELGRLYATQKGDLITITEYDLLDRVVEKRSETPEKEVLKRIQYEYDSGGNQQAIIRFVSHKEEREEFSYDSLNRLTAKKDALGALQTYQYSSEINQKTHTDALGLQTVEMYNERGLLSSTQKIKNSKTLALERKFYDPNGKKTLQVNTVYNPDGSSKVIRTRWDYYARGFLKSLTEAEGTPNAKITHYTYTPKGEQKSITKPDGVVLHYRYNEYGYLESIQSSDGTVDHQMEYNLLGHLQKSDQIKRETDPFGRIQKETFSDQFSIENTYDYQGRRKSCAIPSADCLIVYEYDPAHLKRVIRKKLDHTELYAHAYQEYDLSGNVLEEELICGGGTVRFAIDALSRTYAMSAPFFSQKILAFDPVGNIEQMEIEAELIEYGYDDLYQVTKESGLFAHDYSYDSLHNRLQKDSESYEINELNQIASHIEYDQNGNPKKSGYTTYTYDALDRLIKIESPGYARTYTYDSFHRRLTETKIGWFSSSTTYFIYDGQNEIGSFDESLNLLELRVLGNTPHAEIGAAIAIEINGYIHIPLHDLQGNLACLKPIDEEPTFYRYSAFGEEKIFGYAMSPWRFSSKRTDDSQLVYFGRRYYDPSFGRWLTPDPSGFTDGMNLYAYLHNSPLIYFDEYGLFIVPKFPVYAKVYYPSYFEYRNQPGSRILPSLNPDPKYATHLYVNGIQNTLEDCVSGAATLLKTYQSKANIVPAYSTSFGFKNDLDSVYASKNNPHYRTEFIEKLAWEIKLQLLGMELRNDPRKFFITCFSRGSTDVYHACKDLSPRLKNRLIITACGPIMILPRTLGFIVQNLISEGDWCSLYCNRKIVNNLERYQEYADIRLLPQKDGFKGFNKDHFFQSKTYQEGIFEHCVPNYKKYGEIK